MARRNLPVVIDEPLSAAEHTAEAVVRREPSRSASRRPAAKTRLARSGKQLVVLAMAWTLAALALCLFVVVCFQVEQFVRHDTRFHLAGPTQRGGEAPGLEIDGVTHAKRGDLIAVFEPDFGRSLWRLPVWDRRDELKQVSWVKEAMLTRVWPNRVHVQITERTPVAFIQLPSGDPATPLRPALIDADGVVLETAQAAEWALPVLVGVHRDETREFRARKVQAMLRFLRDASSYADKVSEVDASDPNNLRVLLPVGDQPVLLILGNQEFLSRMQRFEGNYADIHRHQPLVSIFDLRLKGRIIAVDVPLAPSDPVVEQDKKGAPSKGEARPARPAPREARSHAR